MKKTMIIMVLTLAMIALSSSVAFAYQTDTYVDDPAAGIGGATNTIHGTYSASSTYCKSCHDVHGGTIDHANDAYLFRWSTATAGCVFCHDAVAANTTHTVYTNGGASNNTLAEHSIDVGVVVVPDSTDDTGITTGGDGVVGLGCADCHTAAPHGAGEGTLFTDGALIKATDGATITAYCGTNCHDKNDMTAPDETTTHPMAAAESVGYAFVPAAQCTSCHDETLANGFPHDSLNYAFLGADAGTTDNIYNDGVCLACHVSGAAGIGQTY